MHLQELVSAAAAVRNILEEVKLLLLSACPNDHMIEEQPLLEVNVFNRIAVNLMIAQPEHALRHKHQRVVGDLKIAN